MGMLTQLAAATAANGTKRPIKGGAVWKNVGNMSEAGTLHRRLFLAYFDQAVQAQSSD